MMAGNPVPEGWQQIALIGHAENEFDETGGKPVWAP
jgi:hypothetical protein